MAVEHWLNFASTDAGCYDSYVDNSIIRNVQCTTYKNYLIRSLGAKRSKNTEIMAFSNISFLHDIVALRDAMLHELSDGEIFMIGKYKIPGVAWYYSTAKI